MERSVPPRRAYQLGLAALMAIAFAGAAFAQGTDEQREACTPDAVKLCADAIPDVAKTTACMKRHEAELSPRCRVVFNAPEAGAPQTRKSARAKPSGAREAAADDDRGSLARRRGARASRSDDVAVEPGPRRRGPPDADTRRFSRDEPPDDDYAPGPGRDRYGAPDEEDRSFAETGPGPGGDGAPGPGPRRFGPPGPDDQGFDGGARPDEGYGPPDPGWRYLPPSYAEEPPDVDHYGYQRPDWGAPRVRGQKRARAVIGRLCDDGEIDPRTCNSVERALTDAPRRRD